MIPLEIIWNPSPELFNINGISVRYYGLMFVISFVLGAYLLKKIYKTEGVSEDHVESLFMYVVIATILGARLGDVFFYSWDYYQDHLLEILLPIKEHANTSMLFGLIEGWEFVGFRGLASHGATIGIILGMYIYSKKFTYKPLLWILDRIVIPVSSGAAFVRIGNLMNSEIVGKITESPLGFRFIRDHYSSYEAMFITKVKSADKAYDLIQYSPRFKQNLLDVPLRYPTQIFEALSYALIFVILWFLYWKTDKKDRPGYLFGLFMALLWSVRFFIEFFKEAQIESREDWVGVLNTGQLLSIPMFLVGLFFMFRKVNN